MTSLLPPNRTSFEAALEVPQERVDAIPTPLASLWNPDTVPSALLPWLAWSLSLESWQSYWSDTIKRNRVRQAITIARHRGTAGAVKAAVEAFCGYVSIREWWETSPKGTPHTFALLLTLSGADGNVATAEYVDDVIEAVRQAKPLRSHFTFTQGINATGAVGVIAAARPLAYAHLQFDGAS